MKIPIDGYRPVLLVMVSGCDCVLTKIKGPTQYVSPGLNWWASVCYLRTEKMHDLMVLNERINTIKSNIKEYNPHIVLI